MLVLLLLTFPLACLGWVSLSTGDYGFGTEARTWEESRALCAERGSRLVEIRSKEENDAIGEFITRRSSDYRPEILIYWIGLSDQHQENDWRWQGSNLTATDGFTSWNRGEPNNLHEKEHCAQMYINGTWNDQDCKLVYPPICKKGCSNTVSLSGNGLNGMPSGLYKKQAEEHNNKPVYKYSGDVPTDEDWCIFEGGHWKIGFCAWVTQDLSHSHYIAFSKVPADCPEDIGHQWRYYSWAGAPVVDPDLRVTPGDSMFESGFTSGMCDKGNTDFNWCPRVRETSPGGLVQRQVSCWTLPCWKLNHCPRYKNSKRPKKVIRAFPCCCAHKTIHDTEQYKPICKLGNV